MRYSKSILKSERDAERLSDDSLRRLRGYLIEAGWKPLPVKTDMLQSPSGRIVRLPIGLSNESKALALDGLYAAIVFEENRSDHEELVEQIEENTDIVCFGIQIPNTFSGQISIRDGAMYYDRMYEFIGHSLCAERKYQASKSVMSKVIRGELERYSFGKTSSGSYRVAVHFPLDDTWDSAARRVWHRIVRGLERISVQAGYGTVEDLLMLEQAGWNAKMCEILADILDEADAEYFDATVHQNYAHPDLLEKCPQNVRVKGEDAVDTLTRAAIQLRGLKSRQSVRIEGLVYQLRDNAVVRSPNGYVVRVAWNRNDGSELKVAITLSSDDYGKAIEAHSRRLPLVVDGILEQVGRRWVLLEPTSVSVGP